MPSPFPGMDPFIENQEWDDFHSTAIVAMRELLAPRIAGSYIVRVERRIYVERHSEELPEDKLLIADVAVARDRSDAGVQHATSTATALVPVEGVLPMPEEKRESFLYIRDRQTMEIVTVVELLSPGNKRPGSDGRAQYLSKCESILASHSHLVEIDLLRGGTRLPMMSSLPAGDYFAIVSRAGRRPRAEIYGWPLARPLPVLDIPLKPGDADVPLALQDVLTAVYDQALYDLSIDYGRDLKPPLAEAEAQWVREVLHDWSSTGPRP